MCLKYDFCLFSIFDHNNNHNNHNNNIDEYHHQCDGGYLSKSIFCRSVLWRFFFSFFRSSFLNLVVERNTQRHRRLTKTPMHTMFINSFSIASHRMIERDRAEAIKDKRETKFMEKKKKAQKTCSNWKLCVRIFPCNLLCII